MKVDGGCHCGAVAFEATVDPARATICHCVDCQILTGTAYRVSVPAAAQDLRFTRGAPKIYVKTAESGNKRAQAFCGDCGSPFYSSDVDAPRFYMLRVGALRQRDAIAPLKQIWCESARDWAQDISALPRHDKS